MAAQVVDEVVRAKPDEHLIVVPASSTIAEAVTLMVEREVGAVIVMTEDNWTGPVGLVRHNVLRKHYLDKHPAPEDIEYYLCGPDVMNKAVIKMCLDLGVDRENVMLDDVGF